MFQYPDIFDALEFCFFYTKKYNPNLKAEQFASEYHKPLIAQSDTHRMKQLGRTYSKIQAEPNAASIFQAIHENRIERITHPMEETEAWKLAVEFRWSSIKMTILRNLRLLKHGRHVSPTRLRRVPVNR